MSTPATLEIKADNIEDFLTQVERVLGEQAMYLRKRADAIRKTTEDVANVYLDAEAAGLNAAQLKIREAKTALEEGREAGRRAYHEALFPKPVGKIISVAAEPVTIIPPGDYEQVEQGVPLYRPVRRKG
jgi:prefoldin subunit 5